MIKFAVACYSQKNSKINKSKTRNKTRSGRLTSFQAKRDNHKNDLLAQKKCKSSNVQSLGRKSSKSLGSRKLSVKDIDEFYLKNIDWQDKNDK
jgi:hypothetical protein